jgi:hypothetical protein
VHLTAQIAVKNSEMMKFTLADCNGMKATSHLSLDHIATVISHFKNCAKNVNGVVTLYLLQHPIDDNECPRAADASTTMNNHQPAHKWCAIIGLVNYKPMKHQAGRR